ncbi:hypothetical protein OC834_004406 [Tilletia horrida]|uniref:Uncharacterized protein n=1 Tax=Tilletia horrida TaxID=155126 RepID=A0AAN6G4S7_9BASI|nr:hypothetical protein OC842_007117 [Tilletia horrida]KAK0527461.1 hypothetical protein OC834_004406 [Tilletia horrida]KAK0534224.1 hypothetical protein OC835_002761 [Tilletia horrida]KAK0551760.1 hypothetical protein OC844_006528 [Tilletia horrida]
MCHEKIYAIVCPKCEDVLSIIRRDLMGCDDDDCDSVQTNEWFTENAEVCCQHCHDDDESDPESEEEPERD